MEVHDVPPVPPLDAGSVREGLSLAIHGGLGDPGHSVIGLYAPTLRRFRATLVAVDPAATATGRRERIAERLGLSYSECLTPGQFDARLAAGLAPDAALVLTPVAAHLPILGQYARAPWRPSVIVVEKPAVGLDQVSGLSTALAELGEQRCYFIDTAMVAPSIGFAFAHGVVERIGPLRSIVALGIDNPWAAAPGQEQHALAARREAINTRGVLLPELNGGAGAGFDMGIHAVTGLSVVLAHLGLSLGEFATTSVRLELADLRGWRRGPGGETHLLVSGRIGGIDVVVEAGKGSDTWDRRVELHGEDGVCAIGFGTLAHGPGVWLSTAQGEQIWRFSDQDTGYSHHLRDLAILLGAAQGDPALQPAESAHHMLGSLRLMADWYAACGPSAPDREPIPRVAGHGNPHLGPQRQAVRRRLDVLNREVLGLG